MNYNVSSFRQPSWVDGLVGISLSIFCILAGIAIILMVYCVMRDGK